MHILDMEMIALLRSVAASCTDGWGDAAALHIAAIWPAHSMCGVPSQRSSTWQQRAVWLVNVEYP